MAELKDWLNSVNFTKENLIEEDPSVIKDALTVNYSARALERIGDHAKNICEHIIFLIKGKDVRHMSLSELEQNIQ